MIVTLYNLIMNYLKELLKINKPFDLFVLTYLIQIGEKIKTININKICLDFITKKNKRKLFIFRLELINQIR